MTKRRLALGLLALTLLIAAPLAGGGLGGPYGPLLFWKLRVPRLLMGILVGGTLSTVGATYQLVFQNPLATPSTIGTTAGAVLGVLFVLVIGVPASGEHLPVVVLAAFAGALLASLAVAALAASGRARMHDVLLGGIAVSLAAGALSTGLQYAADMQARFAATQWSLGYLPQVGYRGVLFVAPFAATTWLTSFGLVRGLTALASGEDLARAQGVDVPRLRVLTLGVGALGVAACVAWCGPIAFVGLLVPHLVRLLIGHAPRVLVPASAAAGAVFLVVCDTAARLLWPGRELPVGVVTAALGAPALLVLLSRRHRSA